MLQFSRFHFIISRYEVPQNWQASGRSYQQLAEVKLLLTALTNQSLTSIRVPDFPCWISRLIPFRGIKVDSVDCQIFTLLRMIKLVTASWRKILAEALTPPYLFALENVATEQKKKKQAAFRRPRFTKPGTC